MKSTIQDIMERRSTRAYRPDQIKEEELNTILEAGTYAATGMGKQSPVIVVVQDPETIAQLTRMNAAVLGAPDAQPFYGAPTVAVVLADPAVNTCVEDGSLVIGNMMLAASAIGVASCWIHRAKEEFETEEGKALLKKWGLSENLIGVGHCILGYAAGGPSKPAPRKEGYIVRV